MKEIYNDDYYKNYDVGIEKVDYSDSKYTKDFLDGVAQQIVSVYQPRTVLDAGCAMGHLVAALRDRGVEAYGVDISNYAINHVRPDIQSFCVCGSLADPLPAHMPGRYDLVVCIEVIEHLYEEDGRRAIANLCNLTDAILLSSTPDDFTEPTHVNVQQREYWAQLFAAHEFYDDLYCQPYFITPYAICFRKRENWLLQVGDYERHIRLIKAEHIREMQGWEIKLSEKEQHIQNLGAIQTETETRCTQEKQDLRQLLEQVKQTSAAWETKFRQAETDLQTLKSDKEALTLTYAGKVEVYENEIARQQKEAREQQEQLQTFAKELQHYKTHYFAAIEQREDFKRRLLAVQNAYAAISNAACWRMTKPIRWILDAYKRNRIVKLTVKGFRSLKNAGIRETWRKACRRLRRKTSCTARQEYISKDLERQRTVVFPKTLTFSILTPLYNTNCGMLKAMIDSVRAQTYANWELCLADGSEPGHTQVERICKSYARKDPRIRYQKLTQNLGISENTNACTALATGDYFGLLDHDDLLHPAALYEVMNIICETNADLVYTDENTFHKVPSDAYCPHFKPDFAPDTLRSVNYICHFLVFQRELMERVGNFRAACDGSQDYDLVLRLTEQAKKIVHIPKILYYWRASANSTAADIGAKPYVIAAAHRAISEHLERCGLEGEVLDAKAASMYRIRYTLRETPLISILVPNKDQIAMLKVCMNSIFEKTTYPQYEIIIIENNSVEDATFAYYQELEQHENLRVVIWEGEFNYSAINNYGANKANGEYLLLLNNDIEIITPDWLQEMLMFAQREDVGAVGAKLYYPNGSIQHAGVILGIGGVAGHAHKYFPHDDFGYMGRLIYAQNLSAVTAACMLLPKRVFDEIGGFDPAFAVAFNDVDLCMKIRERGYQIVFTPFAEMIHHESLSRGLEDTAEKQMRFAKEITLFQDRWATQLAAGDPFYNPHFTLEYEDFSLKA